MSVFNGHGGHLSFEYCECVVMAHPPEPLAPTDKILATGLVTKHLAASFGVLPLLEIASYYQPAMRARTTASSLSAAAAV